MAKKTRKRTAAKVTKKPKILTKKKTARKKAAKKKSAISKKRRKVAAQKKSKPIAKKKISMQPPESFPHKVADAFTAIVDILTDAERLHHKLDPGVSNEPE